MGEVGGRGEEMVCGNFTYLFLSQAKLHFYDFSIFVSLLFSGGFFQNSAYMKRI